MTKTRRKQLFISIHTREPALINFTFKFPLRLDFARAFSCKLQKLFFFVKPSDRDHVRRFKLDSYRTGKTAVVNSARSTREAKINESLEVQRERIAPIVPHVDNKLVR